MGEYPSDRYVVDVARNGGLQQICVSLCINRSSYMVVHSGRCFLPTTHCYSYSIDVESFLKMDTPVLSSAWRCRHRLRTLGRPNRRYAEDTIDETQSWHARSLPNHEPAEHPNATGHNVGGRYSLQQNSPQET